MDKNVKGGTNRLGGIIKRNDREGLENMIKKKEKERAIERETKIKTQRETECP